MPKLAGFVLSLLVVFSMHPRMAFGQQVTIVGNSVSPDANGPHHPVTGIVVNSVTSEPIQRALVQLFLQHPMSALSGADGRFQFSNVPEGMVTLQAQRPGFYVDARANRPFTVGSGPNDVKLVLSPGARITGAIKDSDGEPIENVAIQVMMEQIVQGRKQWQVQGGSQSEEDGSYQIDVLMPGRYAIFAGGSSDPPEVNVAAYYPEAPDLESAQAIDLQAGQEYRADFRLRTERGFRVTGQFVGGPSFSGGFSLENSSGGTIATRSNMDGSHGLLTLDCVPSGSWILVGNSNDNQGHQYEARQEISVNHADVDGVKIVFHANTSIPVVINHAAADGNSNEAASGVVSRNRGIPGLNATLISTSVSIQNAQYWLQQQGDPPTPRFQNVRPGQYRLDVQTFGAECLESAWSGGVDLLRDTLTVGSDAAAPPITINLRADCPTLTATVRASGENQQQTAILLIVPSSGIAEPRTMGVPIQRQQAAAPAMNSFNMTLPPGSYHVYAFPNVDGLEYANPEVLRGYPSQSVDLAAGQKAAVSLDLAERKEN